MDRGRWSVADRLAAGLLGVTVAIGVLLLALGLGDVPAGVGGRVHPTYGSMMHGAEGGLGRRPDLLWGGWLYGALQIAFFGLCWVLAVRRAGGLGRLRRGTWLAFLAYQAGWAWLVYAYAVYARDPEATALVGAFPVPTAVMVYVVWPLPLLFTGLYLWRFTEQIHTPDDERRLAELLERHRTGPGDRA